MQPAAQPAAAAQPQPWATSCTPRLAVGAQQQQRLPWPLRSLLRAADSCPVLAWTLVPTLQLAIYAKRLSGTAPPMASSWLFTFAALDASRDLLRAWIWAVATAAGRDAPQGMWHARGRANGRPPPLSATLFAQSTLEACVGAAAVLAHRAGRLLVPLLLPSSLAVPLVDGAAMGYLLVRRAATAALLLGTLRALRRRRRYNIAAEPLIVDARRAFGRLMAVDDDAAEAVAAALRRAAEGPPAAAEHMPVAVRIVPQEAVVMVRRPAVAPHEAAGGAAAGVEGDGEAAHEEEAADRVLQARTLLFALSLLYGCVCNVNCCYYDPLDYHHDPGLVLLHSFPEHTPAAAESAPRLRPRCSATAEARALASI